MDYKKVCLTNLSISDNLTHKDKFGCCFVGFYNDRVNRNNICPVIYCRNEGRLSQILKRILDKIPKEDQELLLKYIKPYSDFDSNNYDGPLLDRKHLRRYDEQEWRYVPEHDGDVLRFTPNDVYKVFVQTEEQKLELAKTSPTYANKITVLK